MTLRLFFLLLILMACSRKESALKIKPYGQSNNPTPMDSSLPPLGSAGSQTQSLPLANTTYSESSNPFAVPPTYRFEELLTPVNPGVEAPLPTPTNIPVSYVPSPTPEPRSSFVRALYADLLGRAPTAQGEAHWTQALGDEASETQRKQVVRGILFTREAMQRLVNDLILTAMERPPMPGEGTTQVDWLLSGSSIERVIADAYSSEEVWAIKSGASSIVWLTHLYRKLLGREPLPTGLAHWSQNRQLSLYSERVLTVNDFLNSAECQQKFVEAAFQAWIHRPPVPSGLQFWVGNLQSGHTKRLDVEIALLSSQEYYDRNRR